MPQKTNLNINPYYDDFNVDKNFYRVLFKPGFPVQARELTTLQSILQHQVESFGSHIFKEGSMVIPGSVAFDNQYYSVKVNSEHLGIDVSLYINKLIGKRIKGQNSGVTAVISNYSIPPNDGVDDVTLYVKYLSAGNDFEATIFEDGELLIILDNIVYGNTAINSGDTVATLVNSAATATGSAVGITSGVYFIRGTFVDVKNSVLVLSPSVNTPSYRVGLNITEEIVSSDDDSSLNDNAKGFSNYAAPGADRFKISTSLVSKDIEDFTDDKNFVELIRIENGEIKKLQDKSVYSTLQDYLAKRTYDESGNYSLKDFEVTALNSLNDRISNEGIYLATQKTSSGNVPSDNLLCYKVSPGQAYVRGYDVNIPSSVILDVEKPRDTETISSSLIPFEMGNLLRVNNVVGTPFIGIDTSGNTVKLFNQRKGVVGSGTTIIGDARVYAFNLTDAEYSNATTQWDLYLFDVQTYAQLNLNESLNASQCPEGSYVRGVSNGASGYVVTNASSKQITLTQTSGKFAPGEEIIINEDSSLTRSIIFVKEYSVDDIKSVYQNSVGITAALKTAFSADTVLFRQTPKNFNLTDRITINSAGIATCSGKSFSGIKTDTIIRYQRTGFSTETFNRVVSVSPDGFTMTLAGVATVSGICDGGITTSTTETTTFSLGVPELKNSNNPGLYTKLNNTNVSSVNFSGSSLLITTQVEEVSTNSVGTAVITVSNTGISSAFFESYDSERYSIFYSDGTIEKLSSNQFTLNGSATQITLTGLKASQSGNVTVNVTLRKQQITSKNKIYVRSKKLSVTRTIKYFSTSISGLSTNQYYGLRVEDKEISLNVPDVSNVIAVYESVNSSDPVLDKLTFVSGLNLNTNAVLGEKITGNTSGAVAQIVTLPSSGTEVEFVYLNSQRFQVGELVSFDESTIKSSIQSITIGSYINLTNNYTLDKGQKEQFYDYSKIIRNANASAPSKKLLIIFNHYDIASNEQGDVFTVNSYQKERFLTDIPTIIKNVRASDTLDFRPRVSEFTSSTTSPFYFTNRSFLVTSQYYTISPNESSIVGYSYYLPRIDKIVLNKLGDLQVIKGLSASQPKQPFNNEEAMDIATISLPAYLYNPKDVVITLVDNRRYTMRDIGSLEDRIQNLERTTSLTLLELNTKSLQIQDSDGLSRFKTGFFVDDFKNASLINNTNSDVRCDVDTENEQLIPAIDFWSLKSELALDSSIDSTTADFSSNLSLFDSNVRKTGNIITLNYKEKSWIEQPHASNVENVNPFNVVEFTGGIKLSPFADNWVRNIYIENVRTSWRPQAFRGEGFLVERFVENIVTTSQPDPYFRSRNVEFIASALRPLTRHYSFIDDINSLDIIPKLLEISMVSGTFNVGETVNGYRGSQKIISFRTAKPSHKTGNYATPDLEYRLNPYDNSQSLPSAYSASSTILNVDTFSLAEESLTGYGGYIEVGIKLIGATSGAVATVSNIRLISDDLGDLYGCFFIRDPNTNPPPLVRIRTGDRVFKLNQSPENINPLPGDTSTISTAQATYRGSGLVSTQVTNVLARYVDPLAQTFTVDETGAFLTSVDVYFAEKDPNEQIYVELRTVELGTPTSFLVSKYSTVPLKPSQIKVSNDATVATNIVFPSPVYLQTGTEYALVFLAPTTDKYKMWVGTMGEKTITTSNLPSAESVVITKQYVGGSLFKSQNGTIWTANQYQDLKFKLYKANFTSTAGDVVFYNPNLIPESIAIPYLNENSIVSYPRKLKVGITTTLTMGSILTVGKKVSNGTVSSPESFGYIEKLGSSIVSVSIANTGIGYSGGSSGGTYSNVPFYNITGSGSGATGTVTVTSSGFINTVSIANTGNGYAVGDVLGITTSSVVKGTGARISVSSINGIDTLYLTNVQGEEFINGQDLIYYDGQTAVATANTDIRGTSSVINDLYSGNVLQIKQFNHGMHSDSNVVQIKNIDPDSVPVKLTADLGINATSVAVADTTSFATFEGISTSRGYLKVNNEIIYYTSINAGSGGAGTLGISTRGIDGTPISNHVSGDVSYKYELNGISLTKINKTHNLPSNAYLKSLRDLDTYHVQVDRGDRSSGNNQVNFTEETIVGGDEISVSQNYQFNAIIPQFDIQTPGKNTTVSAQMRTVSGTSSGGTEISFLDQNYEPVELNAVNFLSSPRLMCSRVNEVQSLSGNKSFIFRVRMNSSDSNLSPSLDTQNTFFAIARSRVNNPISDYALDGRSNQITGDPHSSVYISNRVNLEQSATSLKVFVTAYRPEESNFRVLYRLYRSDSSEVNQSFILFPGYDNLRDTDGDGYGDTIIDISKNSGLPDAYVKPSEDDEFLEYQFSEDNLPPFDGFEIKIVMSSINEARTPVFTDIRVIALA